MVRPRTILAMPLIRWNALVWLWQFFDDAHSLAALTPEPVHNERLDPTPDAPLSFGHDAIWLAVRCDNTQAVVEALQLRQTNPANWESGLQEVHQPLPCTPGWVFVSPPVRGWVLVTGALPYPGGSSASDLASSLLRLLGRQFTQVQYFGAHSGIAWHGYARYDQGELVRAFACVDSPDHTIWNQGSKHDDGVLTNASACDAICPTWHQQRVFEVSERWSLNPQTLSRLALPASTGWIGYLDVGALTSSALKNESPMPASALV
jgi:hypothetical protein